MLIEAMVSIEAALKRLEERTGLYDGNAVVVDIEGTGPGVVPLPVNTIFDAFVTTTSQEQAYERSPHRLRQIRSGLPCTRFLWLPSALPGDHRAWQGNIITNLIPASRCRNHTTSPSARRARSSFARSTSTASRLAAVTIASRPACGTRRRGL
jgi:hypothetical protein